MPPQKNNVSTTSFLTDVTKTRATCLQIKNLIKLRTRDENASKQIVTNIEI